MLCCFLYFSTKFLFPSTEMLKIEILSTKTRTIVCSVDFPHQLERKEWKLIWKSRNRCLSEQNITGRQTNSLNDKIRSLRCLNLCDDYYVKWSSLLFAMTLRKYIQIETPNQFQLDGVHIPERSECIRERSKYVTLIILYRQYVNVLLSYAKYSASLSVEQRDREQESPPI